MANYNVDIIYNGSGSLPGTETLRIDGSANVLVNRTSTLNSSKFAVTGNTWHQNGLAVFSNPGNGESYPNITATAMMLGPYTTRSGTAGKYLAGIGFDHLLNYSTEGNMTYNQSPHGWIGLRTETFPGYETSSLVFATRSDTSGAANSTIERMCITSAGNVGIGTTNPGAKLVVAGESQITSNAAFTTHLNYADTGTHYISMANGGATYFRGSTNGITTMTVTGDGEVTVNGTQGQAATSGSTQNNILRVGGYYGGGTGWGECLDFGVHVGISGPSSYAWLQSTNWGNHSINYNLVLNPNGGNVGIGTTGPGYKLDIAGNVRIASSSIAGTLYFGSDSTDIAIYRDNNYDFVIQQNASSGSIISLAGAGNVQLCMDSNNNETDRKISFMKNAVKNGTEVGSINEDGILILYGITGSLEMIPSTGSTAAEIRSGASNGIIFKANNSSVAQISSSGIISSSNITAYGSPSDRKLKENIEPLTNSLQKVMALQGVSFNWKKDTKEHTMVGLNKDIGLIAQNVQQVLPDLVREEEDGTLSLRDRGLVAVLIEAIKEQQSEIDELKVLVRQLLAK